MKEIIFTLSIIAIVFAVLVGIASFVHFVDGIVDAERAEQYSICVQSREGMKKVLPDESAGKIENEYGAVWVIPSTVVCYEKIYGAYEPATQQ